MTAVFLSQKTLDAWTDEGKVRLDDAVLTLIDEDRTVALQPAVHVLAVADGSDDPHDLVGKVKTLDQLKELGAEHYFDSVLHGETAYQVAEGFKGRLSPARGGVGATTQATQGAAAEQADADAETMDATDDAAAAKKLSDLFLTTVR